MSVAHRSLECPAFSQLLPKKKSKSRAWEYFGLPGNESGQIISEDIAVCKLCRSSVSAKSGSTSNLFGHLRIYHPFQFSEISSKSKIVTATIQSSPLSADVDDPQLHSSATASESNQLNFEDNPRHKRQKLMTDFQQLDGQSSKRCTDSVTKFLVCTMQPYHLVDRKEFIDMVKVLNPRYRLPGRKHFTATAVPKLYIEVKEKIKQELSFINKDTISITTDCWTSIANTPYITVTVHFITSEWELKSACLSCAHFDEDHNGENIAEVLRIILEDWEIDIQNIVSVTTDNGRNILKSIELLNLEDIHISCFGHNINIGVNHSLQLPAMKNAIARLKKLQNSFAMSWKMNRDLRKSQVLMQMEVRTLPSACPTRWWSTLKLVKRFLENQLPICKTLLQYPNKKHLMLEGKETSALEDFVKATELLEDMTSSLSGEQYTTASSVLPLYMKIKNNLQHKAGDSPLLKSIKSQILESLTKYESGPLLSNLSLSTLCDPRFRLNFNESPEVKKLAVEKMTSFYAARKTTNNVQTIEARPIQTKKGLAKFFDMSDLNDAENNPRSPTQEAERELKDYLSMPRVPFENDPLDWWKVHHESFPALKTLAEKYLSIQGSSVASERVFSSGGNVITRQRASLLSKHAEMQIFLSHNKKYF